MNLAALTGLFIFCVAISLWLCAIPEGLASIGALLPTGLLWVGAIALAAWLMGD
ncbi:MAG: hypothetical protein AAGF66_16370 [Cyanobacteria bacterium P01_H01_bin.119]